MIVGNLKEIQRYKGLHKNIDTAIDFVTSTDLLAIPAGKGEVDGKEVYYNRSTYKCKPLADCAAENHDNYLDLQIVIKGCEGFGYAHIDNPTLKVTIPYNPEKDVTKYSVEDEFIMPLTDGEYALVFPEDIHKPVISMDDSTVEKIVVKIKIK